MHIIFIAALLTLCWGQDSQAIEQKTGGGVVVKRKTSPMGKRTFLAPKLNTTLSPAKKIGTWTRSLKKFLHKRAVVQHGIPQQKIIKPIVKPTSQSVSLAKKIKTSTQKKYFKPHLQTTCQIASIPLAPPVLRTKMCDPLAKGLSFRLAPSQRLPEKIQNIAEEAAKIFQAYKENATENDMKTYHTLAEEAANAGPIYNIGALAHNGQPKHALIVFSIADLLRILNVGFCEDDKIHAFCTLRDLMEEKFTFLHLGNEKQQELYLRAYATLPESLKSALRKWEEWASEMVLLPSAFKGSHKPGEWILAQAVETYADKHARITSIDELLRRDPDNLSFRKLKEFYTAKTVEELPKHTL